MVFSSSRNVSARRLRTLIAFGIGATMLFSGVSHAQHAHAMPSAPPSAMMTSAPGSTAGGTLSLRFDSVLSRYKPMTDQKLGSWREANDTVTRIGGWRTYLKEAQAPGVMESAAPGVSVAPAKSPNPVAPNPHAGHGVKP
jgi:hypothetical protein